MKASVIIPNLNGAGWLRDSIESVWAQTEQDFELIVIDNGSTDESLEQARSYCSRPNFQLIENGSNTGFSHAVNQGIARAKGEPLQRDKSECLVDLRVDAFIPEKYIADGPGRIEAYKRIAAIETTSDAEDVLDELIDRYGSPPKSVQGLVDVSLVRVTAARVGIAEIVQRGDQLILYSDIVGPKQLGEVMEKFPHRVLYNALGRPYFSLRVQKGESPLVLLRDVVTLLPGAQNQPQTKP